MRRYSRYPRVTRWNPISNLCGSVELAVGWGLVRPHAPEGDFGAMVVFPTDRATGHAAQHGDLPDMGQGVGDGALEQFVQGFRKGRIRSQIGIEAFQSAEEALHFAVPNERRGVMPDFLALDYG